MDSEMKRKWLSYRKIFAFIAIISIAVLAIMAVTTNGYYRKNPFNDASVKELTEGWTDEKGNLITFPQDADIPAGTPYRVSTIVDDFMSQQGYLLFRTDHTFVKAYLNEQEIYSFGKPEKIKIGKTPGSGWQLVSLEDAKTGDLLTVELTSPYTKYAGVVRPFIIGDKSELISYIYWKGVALTIIALIPLVVGIGLIVFPVLVTSGELRKKYLQVGITFLILGCWGLTESRTWQIFLYSANYYWVQMLSFMCFALFTPAGVLSLKCMGYAQQEKLYRILLPVDMGIYVLLLILQLTNICDYFNSLWVVHVMMMSNVVLLGIHFYRGTKQNGMAVRVRGVLFFGLVGVGGVLDLLDFYLWDYFGNGFFCRINFVIILIFCGINATRRAFVAYGENVEREVYEKMAYTDTLTGLGNHRKYDFDAKKLKEGEDTATILYADMNGLKPINDYQGHLIGDKALQIVASVMTEVLGEFSDLYRMGGDEFCALCYQKSKQEVIALCDQINEKLEARSSDFNTPITISYGVVEYHGKWGDDLSECLNWADQEMYKNKKAEYRRRGISRV